LPEEEFGYIRIPDTKNGSVEKK
jgi:hypothetical protein